MGFLNYVILDNVNYMYESGSWTVVNQIKATKNSTDNLPAFNYKGLDPGVHSITLELTTQSANWGANTVGISQLSSLLTTFNKSGASMPIIFVRPDGFTSLVIPTGSIERGFMRPHGSSLTPIEYTAKITLNENS